MKSKPYVLTVLLFLVGLSMDAQKTNNRENVQSLITLTGDEDSLKKVALATIGNNTIIERDLGDGRVVIYNGKDSSILNYATTDGEKFFTLKENISMLQTDSPQLITLEEAVEDALRKMRGSQGTYDSSSIVNKMPEPGDTISGVVKDVTGPMMMVNVAEKDSTGHTVSSAITDMNGYFSFRVLDPQNRLTINYVGYKDYSAPIDRLFYEINMENDNEIPLESVKSTGIPIPLE